MLPERNRHMIPVAILLELEMPVYLRFLRLAPNA